MSAGAEFAIEIEGLTKVYDMGDEKVHALRGVTQRFRQGEFWAIMGHSGSASRRCSRSSAAWTVPRRALTG